jgi:transposase
LTPRKYWSGEKDVTGSISKIGDAGARAALSECRACHPYATHQGRDAEKQRPEARQARRREEGQGGAGA